MNTIVLYIRNAKLRMKVIRILMKNDFYYIEASNPDELMIKLDLAKNASLMIMDYKEDDQETDLATLIQANLKKLPILWIMADRNTYQLSDRVKLYITDILLTPFSDNTLLRKVKAILKIQDKRAATERKAEEISRLPAGRNSRIIGAIKSAVRERFPVCIILLNIAGSTMELNLQVLNRLRNILRQSDEIIETDLGEFLILCPYTPVEDLNVLERKILDAVTPVVQDAVADPDIQIFGANYPDEIDTFNELISRLAGGVS
jgi:FixJ family two-component response regulator